MGAGTVSVFLKEGVHDPEGEKVKESLRLLGIDRVTRVRVGKLYRIELEDATTEKIDEICAVLLVNPVIECHEIMEIEG
ncbi:phosphoribosylformylglycinamidine synthase subunit PurS [Candidatus Bipolaricaulota bacterium]|nr:phosphoribosylformylglycinamidine synthase subunit PurS [Candidatus Bipolaricaulota bacterium]